MLTQRVLQQHRGLDTDEDKHRRVPDLFTVGTELVLADGTVMFLRVMNPFERDEAIHDAQLARSRLVMALKSDHGSDERVKVEAAFLQHGVDTARATLAQMAAGEKLLEILTEIREDPEWTTRLELSERRAEIMARPETDPERQLLDEINLQYITEVRARQDAERDYQTQRLAKVPQDDLLEEYIVAYIARRGDELAGAEYALVEAWYAVRVCDGHQGQGQRRGSRPG